MQTASFKDPVRTAL